MAPHRRLEHIHSEVDSTADLEEEEEEEVRHIGPEKPEVAVGRTTDLAAVECILVAAGTLAGPEVVGTLDSMGKAIELGLQDTGLDTAPGEVLHAHR